MSWLKRKMNKKFGFRKFLLIVVLTAIVASIVGISYMSFSKYKLNAETFPDDGYMLLASSDKTSESINEQRYFNAGETFRRTIDDTVVFTDINGNKVSAEQENFVHYQSGSMNGLAESVVLDLDYMNPDEQVSYYSIPRKTTLNKNGTQYTLNNAGNNINLTNFLWKINNNRYMAVSQTIDLVVSEESQQTFENYVELRYLDEGVVHLVTQDGTYSTVSSDAYLQLTNGVRIYLGSKNISDGENILMNMSQMVVGSDDNIEVIPDEDYTIENEEQPQIVINANDAEDGLDGTDGEKGESGNNRADGKDGKPGSGGKDGNSAPNANVIFEPQVAPIFSDISLETMPYGVSETMKYDANNCMVSDAWISIVDVATGNEVWKKNIYDNLPADPNTPMEKIECDTLHADTQYRMNVYATYATPDNPTQKLSQVMSQELFYTDSYGFSLTKQAITQNSLELNLNKESDSIVETLRVKLFDENLNEIGYIDPKDLTVHPVDTTHSFVVDDTALATGDSIPVEVKGLNSNTVYYAQIQVMTMDGEGSEPTIVPTNSYPKQKYLTKKVDPILSKPSARVDEVTKSFIITPGDVIDKDNGVIGYRLEIYESSEYGFKDGVKPYYTYNVETPLLTNISVPITDDTKDTTKLQRNTNYCAHIVAIFNDNEETVDFRSPVSDDFIAGEGKWPTVSFDYISDYLTASTVEGKIVITDTSGHAFPENSLIVVEYAINETTSDASGVKNKSGLVTEFKEMAIPISEFDHNGFEYSYPISLKSLKENTEYKLTVSSSEFYIDGIRHGSPENLETVASASFKTREDYSPLLIKENDIRSTNPDYATSMFAINLQLAPSNLSREEALRAYNNSIVPGLGNLGDVAGRSATYLQLELYVGIGEDPDSPITKLTTVHVQDCNNFTKAGAPYKPAYGESTDGLIPILGESQYGYLYAFNGSIYEDAYCNTLSDEKTTIGNDLSLILTDSIFTDPSSGYNPIRDTDTYKAGTQFFIKVTAYDYTYGLGENYNINGAGNNKIPVGLKVNDNIYEANSDEDAWISFYSSYAVPAVPQTYPYCENYLRLGASANNVKAQFAGDATYYEDNSTHPSNMQNAVKDTEKTNKETLEALWNAQGIGDTTAVGISYCGPSVGKEGLAQYCSASVPSVCYNIYKLVYNTETGTYDEVFVNTSGFMDYTYSPENPLMPTYTIFYDVEDATTHQSISRGEKYVVETQLRLKGNEANIYPDYWHEQGTLPADDGTIHTYRVFDTLQSSRQVPSILSMPYQANVNNEIEDSDEIYLVINDPDSTLIGETTGANIYQGVFGPDGKPEEETPILFDVADETKTVTETDTVSAIKGNALSEGNLYAIYSLTEENDRLNKYSYLKLMSEENITSAKTITMIDTVSSEGETPVTPSTDIVINDSDYKDFTYSFDGNYVNIDFKYKTINPKDDTAYSDLLGADVIFTKYVYENPDCVEGEGTSCKLVPASENNTLTIFTTPTYDNWESEQIDDPEHEGEKLTIYTQKAKIKIDAIDIASIIRESKAVGIKLALYYDSGDYGIKYFDSEITDKASNYYLIQLADANGKAKIPTASHKYPDSYYETTKRKGVASVTNTKIDDIITPLFTRDEVEYALNENEISSGNKNFTITPVGLDGSIVKNVGADVSNELVTKIDFIMPIAVQTGIKTGYSTAIIDFKVFSADTVLKTGKDIHIRYKKHSEDTYPEENVLTVPFTPSELDSEESRHWQGATITGLTHDEDRFSTEYDYEIWGYANDGTVSGREVKMYTGKFTVNHYDHLQGNLRVETYGTPKTRDTKQLSYALNFRNIIVNDIKSSLNGVTIEMYNNKTDAENGNSAKAVSAITKDINDVFAEATGDYLPTYTYDMKIPWSPNADQSHEMLTGKQYWIRVKYNYKTGDFDEPYTKAYFSLGEDSNSSITGWNSFYNLNSYVITGSKQVEVIGEGTAAKPNYQLKFAFAGKDTNRLESVASDNKLTLLLELCDASGKVVQVKDGQIVETGGEYQRRLITGVPIDSSGSITTKNMSDSLFTFKDLKPDTLYHLNAYFVLDGQNIDMPEIIEQLNLSEIDQTGKQNVKSLATIDGLDVITSGSGVYKVSSLDIRTETNQDLRVDSAILHPESNEAFIIGTNMNFVKRIQYVVFKNGVESPPVRLTGTKLADRFKAEHYSSDLYYLTIPELLQDGAAYIIRIDFYGYEGDTWDNPTMTAQGIHGVEN